ncbi:MAG: helix-turn-helix transcriptional regulator [Bacillota bacterium]
MNKFAERLVEVLKIKGISQNKFAKKLEIAQSTMNGWCKGYREPSFDMLITICKELEESADYLLGLED